jgi:hypothetical protein
LIVAVATPFYVIGVKVTIPQQDDFEIATVFFWKGVYQKIEQGDNSEDGWTSWNDLSSDKPKSTYMASGALAILALIATIFVGILILVALMIKSTRSFFEKIFCGQTKWVVAGLAVLPLILIIISWAVFISFPSALDDAKLCPANIAIPGGQLSTDDLWCSSFIGTKKYDFGSDVEATVGWFPFVGWWFTVVATLWSLIAFILTVLVKRYDYEMLRSA